MILPELLCAYAIGHPLLQHEWVGKVTSLISPSVSLVNLISCALHIVIRVSDQYSQPFARDFFTIVKEFIVMQRAKAMC